jgi:hypothetical protein
MQPHETKYLTKSIVVSGKDTYVFEENGSLYSFDVAANVTELLVDRSIFVSTALNYLSITFRP